MQINCRLPLSVLSVWQCPEATRKRPVCLGINEYERKYKKYFKQNKKEDLLLLRDYPALPPFSLSVVQTVGVLRELLFVCLQCLQLCNQSSTLPGASRWCTPANCL